MVATAALLVCGGAASQPPEAQAGIARLQAAVQQRPSDAALQFALAVRLSRAGRAAEALKALRQAATHSEGMLPITDEHFARLRDDPRYRSLHRRLERRLPRCGLEAPGTMLGAGLRFPEGAAYDAIGQRFIVGSALDGSLRVVDRLGMQSEWFAGDGHGVLGLAVHAASGRLFAVRPAVPATVGNAVAVHELATGRRRHLLDVPAAGQLNDVAALDDTALLVTDTLLGTVWRVPLDGSAPTRIAPAGALPGANGLAVDHSRKRVYVAHGRGIAAWDVSTAQWTPLLPSRSRELLAAIDGLRLHQGDLVAVQNVTHPGRVLRIVLDGSGSEVMRVQTLLSHHHASMREPTALADGPEGLWVLAQTSLSRLGLPPGQAASAALPRPVLIRVPAIAEAGCA